MANPTYGKAAAFKVGLTAGALIDLTDDHGLEGLELTVDGSPIERPTQGDLARFAEAAQQTLGFTFSIEDDSTTHPLFFLSAGRRRYFEYGPRGDATGMPKFTGEIVVASSSLPSPADGLSKYSLTVNVDVWTAAGNY